MPGRGEGGGVGGVRAREEAGQRAEGPAIAGELRPFRGPGGGRQELFCLTLDCEDLYIMAGPCCIPGPQQNSCPVDVGQMDE